jgi:hypothetical protein
MTLRFVSRRRQAPENTARDFVRAPVPTIFSRDYSNPRPQERLAETEAGTFKDCLPEYGWSPDAYA